VPAKVVLQLTTAFHEGGLCNRNGTFSYKDHLRECQTPVLALAGDKDLICPPEAVYGREWRSAWPPFFPFLFACMCTGVCVCASFVFRNKLLTSVRI
jgi:pimeloyl-ACP methyl ester carboxylesterase